MYHFYASRGLDVLANYIHISKQISGLGHCRLPREFVPFTGIFKGAEVQDARQPPKELSNILATGKALVLTGPYAYIDGVFRYCQRQEGTLVAADAFKHITHRGKRKAELTKARRCRLHRLLVAVREEYLVGVEDPPDMLDLQEWLQEPTGNETFLIPVRRLQRILTDIERARNGIHVEALGNRITILPHVYIPTDQSVPAMFAERADSFAGQRVLDMGTGTGILALLAAQLGAAQVVATDFNPNAVRNARLNYEIRRRNT